MTNSDVFRMAVHNLWQRRTRTLFNLTGIVTGCIVLLMTAAGTTGARNAIHTLFDDPELVGQTLTIEYRIAKLRVANIYNLLTEQWDGLGVEQIQKQTQFLQTLLQLIGDLDKTTLSEDQKQQLRELIGSGLKPADAVPELVVTRQFTVRGIVFAGAENPVANLFRQWFHSPQGSVQVHPDVATEIYLSHPDVDSFYNATALVDSSVHWRAGTDALNGQHFSPQSSLAVLENIDYQIDQSAWIVYGVATAILLTAAVGISNTLAMSIVERTPEFGIMKSIGARDAHVLWLMMTEGAILGIVGAVNAILLSLLLGVSGQSLLKMYAESETQTELAGNLFQFQILPALLILFISVTLCVLASLLSRGVRLVLTPSLRCEERDALNRHCETITASRGFRLHKCEPNALKSGRRGDRCDPPACG